MISNKELVLKVYEEIFNNWDISNVDKYFREDYIQHNPTVETGREGFKIFLEKFLAIKPHMEISKIIAEDDLVCVFFKCVVGINGTINKVFDLYRIQDGMIAEHWDCVNHDVGNIECVHDNGLF